MAEVTSNSVRKVSNYTGVVQLTLSVQEARALTLILARAGGDPATSARKYSDKVLRALESIDGLLVPWPRLHHIDGYLTLKDSSLEAVSGQYVLQNVSNHE